MYKIDDRIMKSAGWREKEVIKNAYKYTIKNENDHIILKIYACCEGEKLTAAYDLSYGKWVN